MKSLFIAILTFTFVELIASIPVEKETHNKRSQDNDIQDTRRLLGLLKRFDDVRHLGTRTTEEEATAERDELYNKRLARIPMVPYKRMAPYVPYKRARMPYVPYKRRAPYVPYKRSASDQVIDPEQLVPINEDMAVKEEEPTFNQYDKDTDIQEPLTNEKGHAHEAGEYTDRKILTALQKLIEYIQPSD